MKKILAASAIFLAAQTMTSLALAANVEILTQEACATAIKEISVKKLSSRVILLTYMFFGYI